MFGERVGRYLLGLFFFTHGAFCMVVLDISVEAVWMIIVFSVLSFTFWQVWQPAVPSFPTRYFLFDYSKSNIIFWAMEIFYAANIPDNFFIHFTSDMGYPAYQLDY